MNKSIVNIKTNNDQMNLPAINNGKYTNQNLNNTSYSNNDVLINHSNISYL